MVSTQYQNWQPHVTVAVVAVHPQNPQQFLCVQERSSSGRMVIGQPSGHIEYGENIVDAAVRETLEETAHHVAIEHFISIQHWQNPLCPSNVPQVFFRFVLAAKIIGRLENAKLDDGIADVLWLDKNHLTARIDELRSPQVIESVDDYLNGKLLPLDCIKPFCNSF